MRARTLVLAILASLGWALLPATPAHALLVKVSINFGPTITGPDNGTLVVTADPGDRLRITWALGTDTSIAYMIFLREDSSLEWIPRRSSATGAPPSSSPAKASTREATRMLPILSTSISHPRTGLLSASPGTVVSCGGSTTW